VRSTKLGSVPGNSETPSYFVGVILQDGVLRAKESSSWCEQSHSLTTSPSVRIKITSFFEFGKLVNRRFFISLSENLRYVENFT
jgi:hypothetical protein